MLCERSRCFRGEPPPLPPCLRLRYLSLSSPLLPPLPMSPHFPPFPSPFFIHSTPMSTPAGWTACVCMCVCVAILLKMLSWSSNLNPSRLPLHKIHANTHKLVNDGYVYALCVCVCLCSTHTRSDALQLPEGDAVIHGVDVLPLVIIF